MRSIHQMQILLLYLLDDCYDSSKKILSANQSEVSITGERISRESVGGRGCVGGVCCIGVGIIGFSSVLNVI